MQILNAKDLYNSPLPDNPYWINGLLPKGGLALVGGNTKVGKSWFMLELMEGLANGTDLFGSGELRVVEPARVLYLEREVHQFGVQQRLHLRGKIPHESVGLVCDEIRLLDECWGDLSLAMDKHQTNVLVIDPISRFMANENDADQVSQVFRILEELQKRRPGLGVVLVHHFRKSGNDNKFFNDPLDAYNFRGPARWIEAPDSIVTMARIKGRAKERWRIRTRFITRHMEEPGKDGQMLFAVERDFAVRERDLTGSTVGLEEPDQTVNLDQFVQQLERA